MSTNKTEGEVVAAMILLFLGGIASLVIGVILNGWVLMILWAWFNVPLGFPPLSLVQSMGIALIVHYLTAHYQKEPKEKADGEFARAVGSTFFGPLVALGFGYLIHLFM
jgi:hypothetical protein